MEDITINKIKSNNLERLERKSNIAITLADMVKVSRDTACSKYFTDEEREKLMVLFQKSKKSLLSEGRYQNDK